MPPSSFVALPKALSAIVALLALVAAAYMLAPRSVRESFALAGPKGTGVSSTALFVKSSDLGTYRANLKKLNDVRDDSADVLLANTCYQLPADGIALLDNAFTQSGTLYTKLQFVTFSGDEIKSKIVQNVLDMQARLPSQRVDGPVHVLLTQAPFYRDDAGREMSIQYTIRDYLSKPYNIMRPDAQRSTADIPPIFVTAFIVFAGYTSAREPRFGGPFDINTLNLTSPQSAQQIADAARAVEVARSAGVTLPPQPTAANARLLSSTQSRDKLCFLSCQQTSADYPMFCGCATGTHPYASTCLGPTGSAAVNADKVTKSVFLFGYTVNPKEPSFLKNATFTGRSKVDDASTRVGDLIQPLR